MDDRELVFLFADLRHKLSEMVNVLDKFLEKTKPMDLETIKQSFPEDLRELLGFSESNEYYKIKPKQYLGKENFSKVAEIIKGFKGEYVSAGKDSHFRVSKR